MSERKTDYISTSKADYFISKVLRKEILSFLSEYSLIKVNSSLLDVGCGGQPFRSIVESNGINYFSLDLEQNHLNNVDHLGSIDSDLPSELKNEVKFDILFCTEVMEHVLQWDKAFSNFNKLTTDEGIVLITCPFLYFPHEEPRDYWRPTLHSIGEYAKKHGFTIDLQKKLGDGWDVLGTILTSSYLNFDGNKIKNFKIWILKKFLEKIENQLLSERLHNQANFESNFYLSNFVVLKKA